MDELKASEIVDPFCQRPTMRVKEARDKAITERVGRPSERPVVDSETFPDWEGAAHHLQQWEPFSQSGGEITRQPHERASRLHCFMVIQSITSGF